MSKITDAFALPPVTRKTTETIKSAMAYIVERQGRQADARDIIKGMIQNCGASLTYPSYRTALRCGGIYSEAATCCDLATARLLIGSFSEKAGQYLQVADATRQPDMFEEPPHA